MNMALEGDGSWNGNWDYHCTTEEWALLFVSLFLNTSPLLLNTSSFRLNTKPFLPIPSWYLGGLASLVQVVRVGCHKMCLLLGSQTNETISILL